jgi:osmotically-inducible protein OsmY
MLDPLTHHTGILAMKSDNQLQLDVIAELSWEPAINSSDIGVEVKDGVVTLTGHVGTYAEKVGAERAAMRVHGVKALAIEINVALVGSNARTDAGIARSAENVLEWTTYLPKDAIRVEVESGWITLSGTVDWEYQRQTAINSVRYLMGVHGVNDQIVISPRLTATVVKADIESALKRRATNESASISVRVDGSDVTLSGNAHSWAERELVRNTAWAAPGVRKVVDNIIIA